MPVEYEVEEGNVDRWFFVTRKRDGKEFTVSEIYYATSESTEIEVLGANSKERTAIKAAVSKYLEQKEYESELCKNALKEIYEKYKHIDKVLSDTGLVDLTENDFRMTILYELWISIKAALNKGKEV